MNKGWMSEWVEEWTNKWIDWWMDKLNHEYAKRWLNEWIMRIDKWMIKQVNIPISPSCMGVRPLLHCTLGSAPASSRNCAQAILCASHATWSAVLKCALSVCFTDAPYCNNNWITLLWDMKSIFIIIFQQSSKKLTMCIKKPHQISFF